MQIYTENRFCLPLFYLIVLGGCALYLELSGQGFRHGRLFRSSRRPAAAGSRRAAPFPDAGGFPRILSGYAFQMPGTRPAADP